VVVVRKVPVYVPQTSPASGGSSSAATPATPSTSGSSTGGWSASRQTTPAPRPAAPVTKTKAS
jgi:hypothetical protein